MAFVIRLHGPSGPRRMFLDHFKAEVMRTLHGDFPMPDRYAFSSRPRTFTTRDEADAFRAKALAIEAGSMLGLILRSEVEPFDAKGTAHE